MARGVSEDSPALRPDERGDTKQSVGQRGVRQKIHSNRETFVWERELTSDVAWATDGQGGAVGQGVGDLGKWFRAKKGERVGKLDIWIRMPVHPESAMRGDAGKDIATDDKTLKGRGQVRGNSKASRG